MNMSEHLDINNPKNKCKTCYPDVNDVDEIIPDLIDSSDDVEDNDNKEGKDDLAACLMCSDISPVKSALFMHGSEVASKSEGKRGLAGCHHLVKFIDRETNKGISAQYIRSL